MDESNVLRVMGTETMSNFAQASVCQNHTTSAVQIPRKTRSCPGSALSSPERSLDSDKYKKAAREDSMAYVAMSKAEIKL